MSTPVDLFAAIRARATSDETRAVGIDLGTTNSTVAMATLAPDGSISCTCLRDGAQDDPSAPIVVPTVVAIENDGFVIGREARRLLGERIESAQGKTVFAETKNEIGLRYTYWKAPPELVDATAVAGEFLVALAKRFEEPLAGIGYPVVIGVPSAFHGTQRSATLEAAVRIGLEDGDAALIDEPVAAFLDLVHGSAQCGAGRAQSALLQEVDGVDLATLRRVLVFDFGGGTCDVALFDLDLTTAPARVVLRGTSRYHRLGGGDIDRAIVHQVLLPQLLAQNKLQSLDLSWRQKKKEVEARLILVAEGLKTAMCRRMAQAKLAARELGDDVEMIDTQQHRLVVDGKTLWLENATLTLPAFRKLLEPFLDDAVRTPGPNEYFNAVSVFEPIASLTERLRIDPRSVEAVLFAGGSSLIPPVRDAVLRYFPNAKALGGTDPERLQGSVARGAALQALSLAVTGQPLIRSVSGIDVAIRTTDGLVALIEEGTLLPVDSVKTTLAAPADSDKPVEISVELVGATHRLLFRQTWTLPPPVRAGELFDLSITMDENQSVVLRLSRRSGHAEELRRTLVSPLSHTDASHKVRMRVLEREERIRRGEVDDADRGVEFRRLAEDHAELRHFEKAIDTMRTAIRSGEETTYAISCIGIWYGRLQDIERAEQCYRRSIELEPSAIGLFNLAVTRCARGDIAEAMACIERAIAMDPAEPCFRILKADLLRRSGQIETSDRLLRDLAAEATTPAQLQDWQLAWFESAAAMTSDAGWQVRLKLERERRKSKPEEPRVGVLPARAERPASGERSVRIERGAA